MDDLLVLIAATYAPNEIGAMIPTETRHSIWVRLESVSRAEWYRAGMAGLQPEVVAITPAINYSGEIIAELNGKRYAIYRTYRRADSDDIELYLEDKVGARV